MGEMMEKDNIIDLGEWKTPLSWDDITVEKFSELERFYDGKDSSFNPIDVLHILTDKTADEVSALPIDFVEKILEQMAFLQTAPEVEKPSNTIKIEGETYTVHTERQMKTGEFVAVDTVLKADRHDYASIMAILCRKDGEEYDSKFENEILPDRIELFKKQPISKILPIITFFLNCWALSTAPSLLSSLIEEELNLTLKNLENSPNVGAFKKRYMKWRMKTLKKSLRSISNT